MWCMLVVLLLCIDIAVYQMMMSYFKGTADAVAEYCTAVSCPNAPYTFYSPLTPDYHLGA